MLFENADFNIWCPKCNIYFRRSQKDWEQNKECRRCKGEAKHQGYLGWGGVLKGWRGLIDDSKPNFGIPWGEVPGDDKDPDNPANKES